MKEIYGYATKNGRFAVKYYKQRLVTNVGGEYISKKIILPGQPDPRTIDRWDIYISLHSTTLIGSPIRVEDNKLIVTYKAIDLVFLPEKNMVIDGTVPPDEICPIYSVKLDATSISIRRTPNCYAIFLDISKRFSGFDTPRTIY